MKQPFLNIAFDFVTRRDLLSQVQEAVAGGADVVEVGTPLLKRYGCEILSEVRHVLPPSVELYADLKLLDFPEAEILPALQAGATVVSALVFATDETLLAAAELAREHQVQLWISTMGWEGPSLSGRIGHLSALGLKTFIAHGAGKDPVDAFNQMLVRARFLAEVDDVAVILGGGITLQNVGRAASLGPAGVIVGRGATSATDLMASVRDFGVQLRSLAE
jgi:3-keto-L-gulonate-6-phosphate decarboxylase